MVDFIRKYYPFYLNKSIQNIYLKESLMNGIEIEFYRYQMCVFNRINTSYHIINDELIPKYISDKTKGFANLKMEYFQTSYSDTMQLIFDLLGIFDVMDRNQIFSKLQILQSKVDKKQNKVINNRIMPNKNRRNDRIYRRDGHITSGTYNKIEQIDALLSDIERCLSMKQDTFHLDYDWKYDQYC